jgi:hypothetical protein
MQKRSGKQGPADINEIAFRVAQEAIDETRERPKDNPIGRKGGLKGGKARAKKLTPRQRSEIASMAATARWKKTAR